MKRFLCAVVMAAATIPAFAADVGVSVSIGQPGFYGTIDINNYPRPQVIYARPIVVQPVPRAVVVEPLYLRVPPGHARKWRKHCRSYNACGRPVYFVRDDWYNNVYVPQYRQRHHHRDHDRDDGRRDRRERRDDDRRDDRRDGRDYDYGRDRN